ncbi:MAG: fumarylacetoacetate hydrolase family protein [Pseudomonadota bacterium]
MAIIDDAAQALASHRLNPERRDPLPPEWRPRSEADGYAIQSALHERLCQHGLGPVAGYKIGCTTDVMQRFLDIDHPCAGAIHASRIYVGDTRFRFDDFARIGVECEIAVRIATTPQPPFSIERLSATIGEYRASLELVDDRYHDYKSLDAATLIADDFFQSALVLAPNGFAPDHAELAGGVENLRAMGRINQTIVGEGTSRDILGHPLNALAWLAEHLADQNHALTPGTWITLGSMVETQWLAAGDCIEVEVEHLGRVSATFV